MKCVRCTCAQSASLGLQRTLGGFDLLPAISVLPAVESSGVGLFAVDLAL